MNHCVHCESCHVKLFGALSILLSLIRVVKLPWPGAWSNFVFQCTKHLVYNVSQWSQCFTMFHNVEKPSSTHVHRTAAWDGLSPESSVGVLHFAGGCFNVASLRNRGQRLPFLVTPPRAQARRVTRDPCSLAGRLQPAEDSESAGSDSSFRLHRSPLGPRAIWATMFHNDKTIL